MKYIQRSSAVVGALVTAAACATAGKTVRSGIVDCSNAMMAGLEKRLAVSGASSADRLAHLAKGSEEALEGKYLSNPQSKNGEFTTDYASGSLNITVKNPGFGMNEMTVSYSVSGSPGTATLSSMSITAEDGSETFRYERVDPHNRELAMAQRYALVVTDNVLKSVLAPWHVHYQTCTEQRGRNLQAVERALGLEQSSTRAPAAGAAAGR